MVTKTTTACKGCGRTEMKTQEAQKVTWVPIRLNAQGRCPACEDAYQEYLVNVIDPRD